MNNQKGFRKTLDALFNKIANRQSHFTRASSSSSKLCRNFIHPIESDADAGVCKASNSEWL